MFFTDKNFIFKIIKKSEQKEPYIDCLKKKKYFVICLL